MNERMTFDAVRDLVYVVRHDVDIVARGVTAIVLLAARDVLDEVDARSERLRRGIDNRLCYVMRDKDVEAACLAALKSGEVYTTWHASGTHSIVAKRDVEYGGCKVVCDECSVCGGGDTAEEAAALVGRWVGPGGPRGLVP